MTVACPEKMIDLQSEVPLQGDLRTLLVDGAQASVEESEASLQGRIAFVRLPLGNASDSGVL